MTYLTTRERQVLQLAAEGLTARAIGRRLGVGGRTVETHLRHAYAKLRVTCRVRAVLAARDAGLIGDGATP